MNRNFWQLVIPIAMVVITLAVYSYVTREREDETEIVRIEKGVFEIVVTGMGELEALESTQIMIPEVLSNRTVRIRRIAITDLVKEGTVVEKGDYVATLDPSDVEERMRSAEDGLEMFRIQLDNAKIDSSLVLSAARDEIRQANDYVLDQEIRVEQSIYESVAVQRQAQISLETAQRSLEQKQRNYIQLQRLHELFIQRAKDNVKQFEDEKAMLEQLQRDLVITAPGDGLVVYARGRDNEKVKVGSQVSHWSPLIATLPDLSTLQSVAYIKEIDISKIKTGLPVRVSIDAFPDVEFEGVVTRVANVGQEVEGEFYSAFKVEIKVNTNGKLLLPGMTSSNAIVVKSIKDAILVPRLAVFNDDQIGSFVYKRVGLSGIVKQQIETSGENDSFYKVEMGLELGDRVMMQAPLNSNDLDVNILK